MLDENQSSFKDKHFWSYQKVFLGGRSGTNLTISYNLKVAETPAGKAELFNKYFCSVFLPATFGLNNSEYATSSSITDMEILQIEVSVDEVKDRLSDLDTTKAYGPDKIPARLLKECSEQIAPMEWKSTDVTTIHKKDSKEAAENYCPISLLPIVSKVLESCMGNRFYTYVKDLISAPARIPAKTFLCNPALVSFTLLDWTVLR